MSRDPNSHKGENGKVAVIGGSSTIHGAPIFSALAAEASGVDLVYVMLPRLHQDVARMASYNFQVHPFQGDDIAAGDLPDILELLATMDAAVIGPGLARDPKSLNAVKELIHSASCTLVLDASALQLWTLDTAKGKNAVVTPHLGELERMGMHVDAIAERAQETGVTIHLKGPIDTVAAADGSIHTVAGGDAGLTVGGTGDALAGLIAGFIAQKMTALDACIRASEIIKRAGEELANEQGSYTTKMVMERIPMVLPR